ncbi:MAG: hypothetical protein QG564_239 [Campylobacterota bacterium]|nr:hypothetical protein [Campylobacterota bacterium]
MKDNSLIYNKSYTFAIRIVKLARHLNKNKNEFILSKQILRSGTAIGALVSESKFAQSKADFKNKLMIALKEANETQYWINLLHDTEYITLKEFESLIDGNKEIVSLLVAITKTLKEKGI